MISNFKIGQPVCFLLSLILNPSHNCVYIASLCSRPPSDNPHGMGLRPCVMQHFIPALPEAWYSTVAPSPSQLSKFINLAALRGCKLRSNSSISIMSCFYSFLHIILPFFIDFLYLWLPIYHCITLYRIVSYSIIWYHFAVEWELVGVNPRSCWGGGDDFCSIYLSILPLLASPFFWNQTIHDIISLASIKFFQHTCSNPILSNILSSQWGR